MLLRLIVGFMTAWFVATVIRAAVQAAAPSDPRYRRPAQGNSAVARRRQALAVLGLYDGAKPAEIKKAYKEMAAKYHPDRVAHLGPELVDLTSEKFKQINAAYELLAGKPRR